MRRQRAGGDANPPERKKGNQARGAQRRTGRNWVRQCLIQKNGSDIGSGVVDLHALDAFSQRDKVMRLRRAGEAETSSSQG